MLLIAFVAFLILVVAWLVAPTDKVQAIPTRSSSALPLGEPAAA